MPARLPNRSDASGSQRNGHFVGPPAQLAHEGAEPMRSAPAPFGPKREPYSLNAVLVFLLLVAPWQWTVTRLVVGAVVVVDGAALVARLRRGDCLAVPRGTSLRRRGVLALVGVEACFLLAIPARVHIAPSAGATLAGVEEGGLAGR